MIDILIVAAVMLAASVVTTTWEHLRQRRGKG